MTAAVRLSRAGLPATAPILLPSQRSKKPIFPSPLVLPKQSVPDYSHSPGRNHSPASLLPSNHSYYPWRTQACTIPENPSVPFRGAFFSSSVLYSGSYMGPRIWDLIRLQRIPLTPPHSLHCLILKRGRESTQTPKLRIIDTKNHITIGMRYKLPLYQIMFLMGHHWMQVVQVYLKVIVCTVDIQWYFVLGQSTDSLYKQKAKNKIFFIAWFLLFALETVFHQQLQKLTH